MTNVEIRNFAKSFNNDRVIVKINDYGNVNILFNDIYDRNEDMENMIKDEKVFNCVEEAIENEAFGWAEFKYWFKDFIVEINYLSDFNYDLY